MSVTFWQNSTSVRYKVSVIKYNACIEEVSLCTFQKSCCFSAKNRFIKMQFLYIFNSNFRCFDGLRRRCHLYLVIGLELSFNLVPCTSHGTSWKPSYEPSKFANFVWDLYGIASNSRKKPAKFIFPYKILTTM